MLYGFMSGHTKKLAIGSYKLESKLLLLRKHLRKSSKMPIEKIYHLIKLGVLAPEGEKIKLCVAPPVEKGTVFFESMICETDLEKDASPLNAGSCDP